MSNQSFRSKMGLNNVHPSVIAVWAALVAVANLLPSIPMLGTGSTFSVSTALVPLAGIFFGPVGGAICAAIGLFIGQIIAPHIAWLGLATFLVGTCTAFVTGCVSRGKWWPVSVGIIIVGAGLWFSTDIGRQAPMFAFVVYGLGILTSVIGGFVSKKWLISDNVMKKSIGLWIAAFSGYIASASIANYPSLVLFKLPATVWKVLTFVTPTERTVFAIGAAIIGVPLLIGLAKISIFVGPDDGNIDIKD